MDLETSGFRIQHTYHQAIYCDEALGAQYNILQTRKLKYNDLSHVHNVVFPYVIIFWLIYNMVFKNWRKTHCASLKEKKLLWEEFLGRLACEPQYDS